ncbi:hypothetical protein M9H77_26788 [Catharanthus roseus]|uniref:Uncharacterized protein n=1 Tax=Catharanthus roseus TaxID=4058 RepID=A0ACC0ACK5_CATRO|nr:hypothetical protein M9H77_26788 [Catharanthus roseus]
MYRPFLRLPIHLPHRLHKHRYQPVSTSRFIFRPDHTAVIINGSFYESCGLEATSQSYMLLLKVLEKRQTILKIFGQKTTCAKNVMKSIGNEVLNVLIMCAWKSNRGEYVRYYEGCSYGAHNQGGNAYEWESKVEYSLDAYNVYEDDKAILASCSFSSSILEYILAYRRRKGVGFNTWSELKGALSDKFGVGQFERLEWSQAMGNSKRKQEMYISSQRD